MSWLAALFPYCLRYIHKLNHWRTFHSINVAALIFTLHSFRHSDFHLQHACFLCSSHFASVYLKKIWIDNLSTITENHYIGYTCSSSTTGSTEFNIPLHKKKLIMLKLCKQKRACSFFNLMMLIFSLFFAYYFHCTTMHYNKKVSVWKIFTHKFLSVRHTRRGNTQCQSSSRLCMFVSYCFVTLQFVCLSFRFYTTAEPVWSEKIRLGYLYHDKEDELWDDGVEVFCLEMRFKYFLFLGLSVSRVIVTLFVLIRRNYFSLR